VRWLEPNIDRDAERALVEAARGGEPPHDQGSETPFVFAIAWAIRFHLFLFALGAGLVGALVAKLY
jgi:hypothetical protein